MDLFHIENRFELCLYGKRTTMIFVQCMTIRWNTFTQQNNKIVKFAVDSKHRGYEKGAFRWRGGGIAVCL